MKKLLLILVISLKLSMGFPTHETDDEKSRKIIGQSVVTSVSVIMNGNEGPHFTDAVGKTVPRPFVPPQVASPINLLNPDRYEFYTFNDKGELVKRLMTLREIQSIVANGNGAMITDSNNEPQESQSVLLNAIPLTNHDSETKVQDIVDNVQNVLSKEMENNKNMTSIPQNLLDTPNVSASWMSILPAIFGNTGDEIMPHKPINLTPETEIIDTTTTAATTKRRTTVTSTKRPITKNTVPTKKVTNTQKTSTKRPISVSTKRQTLRPKPTSSFVRSTTRRPIVPTKNNISAGTSAHDEEIKKTVLITSRPFTSTSRTTTILPVQTTRNVNRKPPPTVQLMKKNVTNVINDSLITKIEMRPISVESKTQESEIESKTERVTHASSSTILSIVPQMSNTTEKISVTQSTKIEKLPPLNKLSTTSTMLTTRAPQTSHAVPLTTQKVSSTERPKTTTTTILSPIKLEVTTDKKQIETSTTKSDFSTFIIPSSEEIRNEIAINQIIGSLQNDQFLQSFEQPAKTTRSPPTTVKANQEALDNKMGIDINLMPDKVFLDNLLYVDEKDPIEKDIPTTTQIEDTTTLEPIYEKIISTTLKSKEDSISLENSEVMQTIEKLLQEQTNSKNKIQLEKLDVLAFDDNDETEIKFSSALNKLSSKKNATLSEINADIATIASSLNTKEIITTTEMPSEEDDTTIPTILSEALSNVIQLMMREQEEKSIVTSTTELPTTEDSKEPSLDELNKILYHYSELSPKRDNLEILSLIEEKNQLTKSTTMPPETTTMLEATSEIPIEDTTILDKDMPQTREALNDLDDEKTTTQDPTTQEFTTFFYVSNDASNEVTSDELGAFTTEQFVVTEKRISDRKNEFTTEQTTESDEDSNELFSNVLNSIASTSDEDNASTEKSTAVKESEESDEVTYAISSISSTLDQTLSADIQTDFKLTKNIAASLISVADSISSTFIGNDNESDENSSTMSTVLPETTTNYANVQEKLSATNKDYLITTEVVQETSTLVSSEQEMTITSSYDDSTIKKMTEASVQKKPSSLKNKHKESAQLVKDASSPMVQLNIIRKEDALEKVDLFMPSTSTTIKTPPVREENFIKIESIDTTAIPKLSGFKNKSHEATESIKPIYNGNRSTTTAKSSSLPDILPSQATIKHEKNEEPATERVPLIEKVNKDLPTIAPMVTNHDNLVQIKIKTKPTVSIPQTTEAQSNIQNIKNSIKYSQHLQSTRPVPVAIDLTSTPHETLGLAASTASLSSDLSDFSKLCNELAFTFWKSITADGISQSRSVVISPFALTSTLSMIFLGARGQTSGEMNDLLKLDDTVTFNPHVVFRNISEAIEQSRTSGIATAAFARELYSDRSHGKLLPYFKEKAQQFYGAHVEEVNFNIINDILRRRTNLLVKRHTHNKIKEYLKTNNIWVNEPLAAISANVFMTDCSGTTNNERDGEMFFQVSPAIRQRRLVPVPAAVYRSGFTAGYEPTLDATAVAFGDNLQSTIFVMPGQQGSLIPGDNLERLENAFLDSSSASWNRLLSTFMERPGLEVQIPRFSHRSLINTTFALQQMGLKDIFDANKADLRGLTGAQNSDLFFSDLMQINQFATCGEDKIADSHHIEIYPSPALKREFANDYNDEDEVTERKELRSGDTNMQYKALFYDPIYDSRYMSIPLSLRPRQARLPENPRLRFDRPFLYFVRHNPTGIILFMGRFNPRLLP